MKYKLLISGIIFICVLLSATGCTNRKELGNLSVVTGFFLEQSSNGYLLIADCVDFSKQEHNKTLTTKPIVVTAPSLSEAFVKLNTQSETPLYFERAKIFVIGNVISKNSATEITEELFLKRNVRSDISLLQTKISSQTLFGNNYQPFGLPLDAQLKKESLSQESKLYQLIKDPKKIHLLPTVLLSENGFYLQ